MQNIQKIYRSTYAGETIISAMTHEGQEWKTETEYIPNSVFSTHTTNQAVAIGNGESRLQLDLTHIANHRGGVLAADKLQSYGCNALYRDFNPDFLVATGEDIVEEIANSGYTNDNIVYTDAYPIIKYPGKFYLVPQNLSLDAGALAVYLACFDGHKKVFLIGYDNYHGEDVTNNVYKDTNGYPASNIIQNGVAFELHLTQIMQTYDDVEFVRVMPTTTWNIPNGWNDLVNFRQVDFRGFVLEADLG